LNLRVDIAIVFKPLLSPARYKGAHGGRGSGKSHLFAWLAIKYALLNKGARIVCIREVQKTLKESSKRLIEDKLQSLGLGVEQGFEVLNEHIKTPGDGIISFMGMQNSNAENIKSLEGYNIAWVEEAQTLSDRSLALLRPTIRQDKSELWFSWNARRKTDAVDKLLRPSDPSLLPTDAVVVQANWSDNSLFPAVLEQERLDCLRCEPDQYDHIWEGAYATILVGAYYATNIQLAKTEGRVTQVTADPLLPIKIAIDIGGTGARADAFAMWVFQNVGTQVRLLDTYEAVGQPLATHVEWMRLKGYTQNRVQLYLPHDGTTNDKIYDVSFESSLRDIGYDVTVIPNQGKGAAMSRIECARRMFSSCYFNINTTEAGLEALGWYHEKKDETRAIGLGPEHDWASHSADAFGLAMIVSEESIKGIPWKHTKINYSNLDRGTT
jgi:phage terminase large subunit